MNALLKSVLKKQLEQLVSHGTHSLLRGALHGIEKEGLRVTYSGDLSQAPHPAGLGSALTNSNITTDFSESLLELITPVFEDAGNAIQFLENLHSFTYRHLNKELIWAGSMPCHIPDPEAIPIARFGSSNAGQFKHIYRIGLKHRYGKMMQSIAGIHYNFSLPDIFWQSYQERQKDSSTLQSFRSSSYFKMIRNFRRYSWLLLFLFGASPALSDSFLKGKKHKLELLHDHTLYLPYATSLRMSDLGYSTKIQSSLNICFNHLNTYIESLHQAIQTSYPPYKKIGVKVDGRYRQLNDTILQIENEHYSDIRPKRIAKTGERPLCALERKGVQYIEVRNTDVNPFLSIGIDTQQALFLDAFLISCLFMDDTELCPVECEMVKDNVQKVITRGRDPELSLNTPEGETPIVEAGRSLLNCIGLTSELLDEVHETKAYSMAVNTQKQKLEDASQTPSAQVLEALRTTGLEYSEWILLKSREHKETLSHLPSNTSFNDGLDQQSTLSMQKQKELEAADTLNFDQFLENYMKR